MKEFPEDRNSQKLCLKASIGRISARGGQKPGSGIDIIVDFSRSIGIEFIDLADFIVGKLDSSITLVSRKDVKHHFLQSLEKETVYV